MQDVACDVMGNRPRCGIQVSDGEHLKLSNGRWWKEGEIDGEEVKVLTQRAD